MPDDLSAAGQRAREALAELTGFEHAVFVQSGTAALEVALSVLTSPGDRVSVPGLGCWTVAYAAAKVGRKPVFADIDAFWSARPSARPRVSASVIIDPWGAPGDWRSAGDLGATRALIADVTHAPGARVDGERAARTFDAAILSFGWGKPFALGGGGCALFRDARAAEEAGRYLRFGFLDGRWTQKIDRYAFSPFLFPALCERLTEVQRSLERDIGAAEQARRVFAGTSFTPNPLRPGGQWGRWSVLPLRVSEALGLGPRDLESVAVSSGVPLVRHPISPAYLEPAWGGDEARPPRCPRAEALASRLVCFERIHHQDELTALRDFLERVERDADQLRAPYRLPRARGHLPADLRELARRARLARALDGQFYLLDEIAGQKVPLGPRDAALVQQLQRRAPS